jgi:hypothetical protein
LIEYVDKMLKRRDGRCLRHHHGKIAAAALAGGGPVGAKKTRQNNRLRLNRYGPFA